MIHRMRDRCIIEGFVATAAVDLPGTEATETVRCRIEIDLATGLIEAVSPLTGTPGAIESSSRGLESRGYADEQSSGPDSHDGDPDLVLGEGFVVLPGFVDAHVHAREDASGRHTYKEDFATAGRAAVRGGITAFVEMPNNPVPPADDATYRAKRQLAEKSVADVLLYALVAPGTEPLSFEVPYKAYMAQSIGDDCFSDEATLRAVLPRYSGKLVAFHAEHPDILRAHEQEKDHYARRPREAEIEAIRLALRLARDFGIDAHICHLSTAEGLEIIREARAKGANVTTEVTPHHLYWDRENAATFARPSYLQCNPPIRTRRDRLTLLEALRAGDIEFLATDHAPHTIEEKDSGVSGVTQLDTYGNFVFWLLDQGFTFRDIVRVACENPGRFAGRYLGRRFGRVAKGYTGSLAVLERRPTTIRRQDLATRAGWSAFEGQEFAGRVSHCIVRGRIVVDRTAEE
jgi:dihydroorotase